jgi:hypothetical protein
VKVKIKEQYFKRSRPGSPPITYNAWGNRRTGEVHRVLIKKDPALKAHPKLERDMMHHELVEIKLRSKGMSEPQAHKIAMSKERKSTKGKTLKQMWKELK